MTRYIAQRLLVGLLTAFLVSLMLFTVLRVIPRSLSNNSFLETKTATQ